MYIIPNTTKLDSCEIKPNKMEMIENIESIKKGMTMKYNDTLKTLAGLTDLISTFTQLSTSH